MLVNSTGIYIGVIPLGQTVATKQYVQTLRKPKAERELDRCSFRDSSECSPIPLMNRLMTRSMVVAANVAASKPKRADFSKVMN
jgi:hypothetical protein